MGIEKDPKEDINVLEEIVYEEVYSDINSPGYWISKNEEELITPKIIILDGHSTLFVYDQQDEDLPWTAYNELGQYKYTPEKIGDGIVLFPHTFYFEFNVELSTNIIKASGSFDGSGIKALALPMKGVPVSELFEVMRNRITEAISSVLQSVDDQLKLEEGKEVPIPKKVSPNLSIKLSLMGINLTKLVAETISPVEVKAGETVEEVYETPPTKAKDQLEKEKEEKKKARKKKYETKPKPKARKEKVRQTVDEVVADEAPSPKPAPPPGTAAPKPGLPKPSGGGGPPTPGSMPPPVSSRSAAGGPPPTKKSPTSGGPSGSAEIATPPASKPAPSVAAPIPSTTQSFDLGEAEEEFEDTDEDDDLGGLLGDELLAKGMESIPSDSNMILKHTHASYFERMIPNRAYPLIVKITTQETGVKKSVTSFSSGEVVSEKEETIIVSETDTMITIRPEFAGCFVVPTEQEVDISKDEVSAKFHVTPIAIGQLDSSIKFIQGGKEVHAMLLETKVITHRISKWFAYLGAGASAIPVFLAFMLEETPAEFMEKRLDTYSGSLGSLGILFPAIISGIFIAMSGFLYRMRRPRRGSTSLAFPR